MLRDQAGKRKQWPERRIGLQYSTRPPGLKKDCGPQSSIPKKHKRRKHMRRKETDKSEKKGGGEKKETLESGRKDGLKGQSIG